MVEDVGPYGEYLFGDGRGLACLVAVEARCDTGVCNCGEDLLDEWMVFIHVGGEKPSCIDDLSVMAKRERTFVDRANAEVDIFDVGLFVVDVAGEREVDGGGLELLSKDGVFPFDGWGKGIGLATGGENLLDGGDVVE